MKACRPLLGTYVDIRVDHPDDAIALAAVEAGFSAIAQVERLMSVFIPDAEISRINRLAAGESLAVSQWMQDILAMALSLHEASNGLFDCGIAPQLADWGLLPAGLQRAAPSSIANLHLAADGGVHCRQPVRLDLGGIAKGFAVDRAVDAIRAAGGESGRINAGGDLRVFGAAEEDIFLRNPAAPEQLHFAGKLNDGACATSATYFSRRQIDGREVSALVDPRSRQPLQSRRSYTVIAPHCVVADALTKVLALSENPDLPCFSRYDAHPIIL